MSTTYMSLDLPVVGPAGTAGPDWATMLNAALTLIDSHNHLSGKGDSIPIGGIVINEDINVNSYNVKTVRSLRMNNNAAALALATDLGCVYQSGGNLYFNNASGTPVQITSGAGLNLSSVGTIGGDYGTAPASVIYTASALAYSFFSSSGVPGYLNAGPVSIYDPTAGGKRIQLKAASGLAADFALTLPTSYGTSGQIITADGLGACNFGQASSAGIADSAIIASKIATDAVETAKIKNGNVTRAKLEAVGQQLSSTSAGENIVSGTLVDVTNLSVTITTTGRPVYITLIAADADLANIVIAGSVANIFATMALLRDSTEIKKDEMGPAVARGASYYLKMAPGRLSHIDIVGAGTYTYKVQAATSGTVTFSNVKLLAYEL